jgi:hypothetical protein
MTTTCFKRDPESCQDTLLNPGVPFTWMDVRNWGHETLSEPRGTPCPP